MANSGSLEKMVLTSYTDNTFTSKVNQITVGINPESYSQRYTIQYNDTQAQGSASGSPQYNRTLAEEIQFQLIFDGTGVVPSSVPPSTSKSTSTNSGIADQITAFLALAFSYDGEIHSPNFIQISWGTMLFQCRLSSLNLTYTLFLPDGTPLRAKADLAFTQYTSQQLIAKEESKASPDMSHLVTVQAGDTLPLLCYRIYGSSSYYLQVANANGLMGFRALVAGQKLLFPPISGATS